MLHLANNIKKIRKLSNKTQEGFAKDMGVTVAMQKSYEGDKANPDAIYLEKLAGIIRVIPSELTIREFSAKEIVEKIEIVEPLPEEPTRSYTEKRRSEKQISRQHMAPLIPVKAQAGYVRAVDQSAYIDNMEQYALPPGVKPQGAIWAYWEIEGDSMEPVFKDGDIILTSQVPQMDWEQIRNFYIYVIVTEERVLFKRIYCKNAHEWVLISENEENHPQQLLPVEYIKQVWVYRKTIKTDAAPTKEFKIKV
jgi:phage repressor protein C with HTH and peptisase S24 domain